MLVLQHYSSDGWKTLGTPYCVNDTQRVQQLAAQLAPLIGAVWRVVGMDSRVLSVYDGRRWHATAESVPMRVPWWEQKHRPDFIDTIPTR